MAEYDIDISSKMIKYAQGRNPTSQFIFGGFLEKRYPQHHYDDILMDAFLHLFPKGIALDCLDKIIYITKLGSLIFTGTTKSQDAVDEG